MKLTVSTRLNTPQNDTLVSLDELIKLRDQAGIPFEDALNTSNRAEAAAARVALQQAVAAVSARINPGERRRQVRTP